MPNLNNLKADQDNGKDPILGIYRARVESNLDPLHLGRIKPRIPQLHGISGATALSNEALPWAFPITLTGTGYNHGSCIVPETGDYVFVMFENGDRNSPVYLGGCYGIPNNSKQYGNLGNNPSAQSMYRGHGWKSPQGLNEVPAEVYPVGDSPNGKIIYKSPKGFVIMIDETDNCESLIICDNDNQQIKISNPSDDSISEIAIEGKDGQSIHVLSSVGQNAEVIMISPNQGAYAKVTDSDVELKCQNCHIHLSEETIDLATNHLNIKGNVTIEGYLDTYD